METDAGLVYHTAWLETKRPRLNLFMAWRDCGLVDDAGRLVPLRRRFVAVEAVGDIWMFALGLLDL